MIYNIVVGEADSFQNPIQVFETLDGPDVDLKLMWDTFEANIEGTIGPYPQGPFMVHSQGTPAEQREHARMVKLWEENQKAVHAMLKETWNIPPETTGYLNTRYFIEFLITHHNFNRVKVEELFTENF
jgi:hypothetical protein